ncbi:MAG: carboxypeptidase-like regulatory domain-containing protein [Granulosicoccus sp.]
MKARLCPSKRCLTITRLMVATTLFALSCIASASSFVLQPMQWNNIVIPADPAGMSVGELFSDDMVNSNGEALEFPNEWVIYAYDPSIGNYRLPPGEDYVPAVGEAIWIIHSSDVPVSLDIPVELQGPLPSILLSGCASDNGCVELELPAEPEWPSGDQQQRYSMHGLPYPYESVLADWRVTTGAVDTNCTEGCTLDAASAAGYTASNVWYYQYADDGTASYAEPVTGDVLSPWQGYWFGNVAESLQPRLLLPVTPTLSTVTGRVTTADGSPVAGASIQANSGSDASIALTATDGNFSLTLIADTSHTLDIQAEGYTPQIKVVQSPMRDELLNIDVTVQAEQSNFAFENNMENVLEGVDGAYVALLPDSFVDSSGQVVTDTVFLSMTSVDVSNPADLDAFPGNFAGRTEAGVDSPIASLGVTHFEFTTSDGTPVQLAEDTEAAIAIPIYADTYPDGSPVLEGDTIALWSLDEETGQWVQEGEGTVIENPKSPTRLSLEATVSHFSWWNCDVTLNAVPVRIQVAGGSAGTALIRATASANLGWRPDTVTTVIGIGDTTQPMFVPNGIEVCYSADLTFQNGSTATTNRVCLTLTSSPQLPILLTGPDTNAVLTLQSSLSLVNGELSVEGYVGETLERIQLYALSAETAVDYTILDGGLPNGVELRQIDGTRAEIAGVPTEAGEFAIQIGGTNEELEGDSLDIVIDIQLDQPDLPTDIFATLSNAPLQVISLNEYNIGGPATQWQLDTPLPQGMTLNGQTGDIVVPSIQPTPVPGSVIWSGTVTASNDAGTSSAAVELTANSDAPNLPSAFTAFINIQFEQERIFLDEYNFGGVATQWQLDPALPAGMTLDAQTGIILVPFELQFNSPPGALDWSGTVTASNNVGSSTANVDIFVNNFDIIELSDSDD